VEGKKKRGEGEKGGKRKGEEKGEREGRKGKRM